MVQNKQTVTCETFRSVRGSKKQIQVFIFLSWKNTEIVSQLSVEGQKVAN